MVKDYLESKESLRKVAGRFGISHLTLWRWVRWYKSGGEESLNREKFFSPWNRMDPKIEKEIARIKEEIPAITIARAKKILERKGIRVSKKTIWKVWKRYGLINRDINLNSPILLQRPEAFLDEEILSLYNLMDTIGQMDFQDYYKNVKYLRVRLEKKRLFYSSLYAGILEAISLSWMGKAKECVRLLQDLRNKLPKKGDALLKFHIYIGLAMAYARMLRIKKAMELAKVCKYLCGLIKVPILYREIANLYTHIGYQNKALIIVEKLLRDKLESLTMNDKDILNADMAILLASAGKYNECLKALRAIRKDASYLPFLSPLIKSQCTLGQGKIYESLEFAQEALAKAKKSEILNCLHVASLTIAACFMALGQKEDARRMIKKYNPLFSKHRMEKDLMVRRLLLSQSLKSEKFKHPVCRLIGLLKIANKSKKLTDYHRAYRFAQRYKLMGIFHRFILFFPEMIAEFIKRGWKVFLPRPLLDLPVFNKESIVYTVNFLGDIKIYREIPLNVKLTPKEASFLIFLATQKRHSIPLKLIYEKFWHSEKSPARNLSHLLWNLKEKLAIPSNMLHMKGPDLICRCHFLTDWDEFERCLIQAEAMKRLGDMESAKNEYQKAISLFKGEVFKNIYDKFAVEKRDEILAKYELALERYKELKNHIS